MYRQTPELKEKGYFRVRLLRWRHYTLGNSNSEMEHIRHDSMAKIVQTTVTSINRQLLTE